MNRITATLLCLVLCLAGISLHATAFAAEQTSVSTPSAPSPATPAQAVALKTPVVPAPLVRPFPAPLVRPFPAPLVRPFPAPVTTRTVTVPGSIDATGSSNVSAALNAFIATVPDGSIISFPTGATYLIDGVIVIANRHNLVFEGNGTTLLPGPNVGENHTSCRPFSLGWSSETGSTDIVIHDFIVVGNSPTPGIFISDWQAEGALQIEYDDRVEVYNITASAIPGDFAYCMESNEIWIHDCHVLTTGRNNISVISGSNILVERNAFDVSGWCTFDIEPNVVGDVISGVTARNNTVGTWSYAFLALGSVAGGPIDKIVVDSNTVTGDSIQTYVGNSEPADRITRVSLTNNKGTIVAGPVISASHIDSLTVAGNVQPLTSGVLKRITDCTEAGTP